MRLFMFAAAVAATFSSNFVASAAVLVIDSFTAGQSAVQVIGMPSGPRSAAAKLDALSIIGGEREIQVERTSMGPNAGQASIDVGFSMAGAAAFASGPGTRGTALFTYDGRDALETFHPTGLGGMNFSGFGLTQFRIAATSDNGGLGVVEVYSAADQFSRATFHLPMDPVGFGFSDVILPFSSFVAVAGGGADFSNVGAIRLMLDGTSAAGTGTGTDADFTAESSVPEPAPLLLLGSGVVLVAIGRRRR